MSHRRHLLPRVPRLLSQVSVAADPLPRPTADGNVPAALKVAVRNAVLFARALWLQRAQDYGVRRTGQYLSGIQNATIRTVTEQESADGLELCYEIVNTAPHAHLVEDGHRAFNLPSAIRWNSGSGRIKRGKRGPYLHIPFQHAAYQSAEKREQSGMTVGTLKTMLPEDIYRRARSLKPTVAHRTGPIYKLADGGTRSQFVAADRYDKGGRLVDKTPGPRFVGGTETVDVWRSERTVQGRDKRGRRLTNPAWATSRFQGLMKSGPKGHSQYLTIRTITPNSRGWNIPAQQGLGIARQVAGALNGGVGHERFREMLIQSVRQAMGFR